MRYTIADLVNAAKAIEAVERMTRELAEFAAQYSISDEGIIEYIEISSGDAFDVPPEAAIRYFRSKGLRPTFSYADMVGKAHDQAFTVAKMMDIDLLSQVRNSLDAALANGVSFDDWRAEIEPMLRSAGWWGMSEMLDPVTGKIVKAQLGSAWRLETIFRTNLQTAYAAGQWGEIVAQSDIAPYLMYDAIDDFRTREQHRAWDGVVLPVTSHWWKTHMPPNGWNCRCGVIQLDGEQLREFGITPRAEPPDDGAYKWRNPRTGETLDVPIGIDPGFDRNPGDVAIEQLNQLMREKVKALPKDMQATVEPVLRREFNVKTEAGRWHILAFAKAPEWLLNRVLDNPDVEVEYESPTAFARLGRKIDMDGHTRDSAESINTWRHEFGHIMDVRMAVESSYRSYQSDFIEAQRADAEDLLKSSGVGRKPKARDKRQKELDAAYEAVTSRLGPVAAEEHIDVLRSMAKSANLDFDAFLSVVRESTIILDDSDLKSINNALRVGRMIEAVRLRDPEAFIRFASYKDIAEDLEARGEDTSAIRRVVRRSWEKDGTLMSFSDLIGSATKNKLAPYSRGYPGHSDSYYEDAPWLQTTESFANLTALAGAPNPYWWELVRRFTPRMADLYRKIIEGKA